MLYCESSERNSEDSFELSLEYRGKIVQRLMQRLANQVYMHNDRSEYRNAVFPQRLVDSQVLEHFRT